MMSWSYDSLWQKTKLYVQRALEAEREGPLFPFWAILALELLGRATLAKVHPALLADPQQGENILHAFGYGAAKNPKSVPAKTVFLRCKEIVPNFTEQDFKICMGMIERRNEELHAGAPAFEDLPTQLWLADYFRLCQLLLSFQELTLVDLFGQEEASAAEEMIQAAEEQAIKKANQAIEEAKKQFLLLSDEEQQDEKKFGGDLANLRRDSLGKLVECPACAAQAVVSGKQIRANEPELVDDMIVREVIALPTKLDCYSCKLTLRGYGELHAAGLGGQYAVKESYEPLQYYSADLDPADYNEDEYGND